MDYESTVDYILRIPRFAQKIGTENLENLMMRLGHPERAIPSVHVAGTNGKGSVCKAVALCLQEMGYKVGLFTSPHLVRINERIQVNGEQIGDDEFADVFREVYEHFEQHPSFFEVMFAMAAVYFSRCGCDYAVYETGMGGRLDATNVLTPELTVITSIGMDHMEYLGDTIEKIAAEKAGIIKSGVPVVYVRGDMGAADVVENTADKLCSQCIPVEKSDYIINHLEDKSIDFSLHNRYYSYCGLVIRRTSSYQLENMSVAAVSFSKLMELAGISEDCYEKALRKAFAEFAWEGRMEEIAPHIYVDGAHNVQAIKAYTDTLHELYGGYRGILVFAAVKDKEYASMIELLADEDIFDEFIVTSVTGDRRADAHALADIFRNHTDKPVTVCDEIAAAMDMACSHAGRRDGVNVYCVGSLYLVGEVKRWSGRV